MSIQFEYFYGSQAEQFSFYRIPKVLFTDEAFTDVSVEAKVLFMLDRMSLSVKNCWFDDDNRVYIIYTIDDILSDFGCARQKALKLLDELEKGIGLIERKRQGLGWMKSLLLWLMLYAVMSRQYASTNKYTAHQVQTMLSLPQILYSALRQDRAVIKKYNSGKSYLLDLFPLFLCFTVSISDDFLY